MRHPREWPWSSYAGYANRRQRADFVSYDVLLSAWRGEMGGGNPEAAYRRFVEAGIAEAPEDPFREAVSGWLLGTQEFVERMRDAMRRPTNDDEVPAARRLGRLELDTILTAVSQYYGVPHDVFRRRRGGHISRDVAAWLSRQLTTLTLRELAGPFGLNHPDSVSNLTRRVDRALAKSSTLRNDIEAIRQALSRTGTRWSSRDNKKQQRAKQTNLNLSTASVEDRRLLRGAAIRGGLASKTRRQASRMPLSGELFMLATHVRETTPAS